VRKGKKSKRNLELEAMGYSEESIRNLTKKLEDTYGGVAVGDTEENLPTGDLCVCIRSDQPSPFTDNLKGTCHFCGAEVVFRPYVPVLMPKVCGPCFFEKSSKGEMRIGGSD
jgi:hypothetical protein